jgi:tetratricopeptide (TPR) repeat protein
MTSAVPPAASEPAPQRRTTARRALRGLSAAFAAEPELISACLEGAGPEASQQATAVFAAAQAAHAQQPCYADLSYHAARAALAAGRHTTAARFVQQALRINPTYHDALLLAARIELHRGRSSAARRHLEAALAHGADYPDVHALLGRVRQQEGDWAGARQAHARALALNPALAESHAALAALAVSKGRDRDELPA